jgi:hypothetical protein
MRYTSFTLLLATAVLPFANAETDIKTQPALTADDLSWVAGIQYVKGTIDAKDPQRPKTLRLLLQKKGSEDVELIPEITIFYSEDGKEPTKLLFTSTPQSDNKRKLFIGTSGQGRRSHGSTSTDAFANCKVVCTHYLDQFTLKKGKHVLLYGDGGSDAHNPASQDFQVRVVLEAK